MSTKNQNKNLIENEHFSIEISSDSGFCFGVVNAIETAEKKLDQGEELFCVGDIVHNEQEITRLEKKGLHIISKSQISNLKNKQVIFRAHGEPSSSYTLVKKGNNQLIDATCPVVLKIQQRIKSAAKNSSAQIVIYGKADHPEVIGLLDQAKDKGICVEKIEDLDKIDFTKPIELFSQTTKSISGFNQIASEIERKAMTDYKINDTICRQVACRGDKLINFAKSKDLLYFVGGSKSSNAKVLFNICKNANPATYFIESAKDIEISQLKISNKIGICGATSTPQWLMQNVMHAIETEKKKIDINK